MSLNIVKNDGSLERVAGLVKSDKVNEMYEAFPNDASASNKLVTTDSLNEDVFETTNFYKTSKTFSAGGEVVYYKICTYTNYYPFIVRLEGQRTNTTMCVQEVSGAYYLNTRKYTLTRIANSIYASSAATVSRAESNYLIVDANNDVWVAVASYSRVKVTILASQKIAIDGTSGTPVESYQIDGYSDADSKLTSTVTSGSTAPITSDGVYSALSPYRKFHFTNTSVTIPFGSWGVGLCMGNIDGSGNFAFWFTRSTSLGLSAISVPGESSLTPTVSDGVISAGNTTYGFSISVDGSNLVFKNTGSNSMAVKRGIIICADSLNC